MHLMHHMGTAASHFTDLMSRASPATMRCGIGNGRFYEIRISPTSIGDAVWDHVEIRLGGTENDFVACGNRCGGRETLAALYAVDMFAIAGSVPECDIGLHDDNHVSRQVRAILGIGRQEAA